MANADGQLTYNNKYLADVAEEMILNKEIHREGQLLWKDQNGKTHTKSFGTFSMTCRTTGTTEFSGDVHTRIDVRCDVNKASCVNLDGNLPSYNHKPHSSDNFIMVKPVKSKVEFNFDDANPLRNYK